MRATPAISGPSARLVSRGVSLLVVIGSFPPSSPADPVSTNVLVLSPRHRKFEEEPAALTAPRRYLTVRSRSSLCTLCAYHYPDRCRADRDCGVRRVDERNRVLAPGRSQRDAMPAANGPITLGTLGERRAATRRRRRREYRRRRVDR